MYIILIYFSLLICRSMNDLYIKPKTGCIRVTWCHEYETLICIWNVYLQLLLRNFSPWAWCWKAYHSWRNCHDWYFFSTMWYKKCIWLVNFNTISVISWQTVLLVEETWVPAENHQPDASHWQTLLHNVVCLTLSGIQTLNITGDRHWLHR